jgi:hypothetical protein
MASASEDFSSDNESSISGDGLDFLDAPPLADANLPNNGFDVGEEERMFEQAEMYADRGNGCFANEEILSICLLGIMRDIGAPLKTYGRIVALFKDVTDYGTRSHHHQLLPLSHSHQPFLSTILHKRAVSHCFDKAKSFKTIVSAQSLFTMLKP